MFMVYYNLVNQLFRFYHLLKSRIFLFTVLFLSTLSYEVFFLNESNLHIGPVAFSRHRKILELLFDVVKATYCSEGLRHCDFSLCSGSTMNFA